MKSIAIFNNKGGVGKSTLTFHAAHALSELGHKTLLIDLDPQSNLTIFGQAVDDIDAMWNDEEEFIEDFKSAREAQTHTEWQQLLDQTHSIHFLLKPTEDGTAELDSRPPPVWLNNNLALIPGRLSLHTYEDRIASRWSDAFRGDPLALRTITRIRSLCEEYAAAHQFEYVLIDTSPSLGILNKIIISTMDGFVVPCGPDVFSLYGIRNIGRALGHWRQEFQIMRSLLSQGKRNAFPNSFVQFLGYTVYNAKKYTGQNEFDIATAHYNYVAQIPDTIQHHIPHESRAHLSEEVAAAPIGGKSIIHTHNTLPTMAQYYRSPMWAVPDDPMLEPEHRATVMGNRARYYATQSAYHSFATALIERINTLG